LCKKTDFFVISRAVGGFLSLMMTLTMLNAKPAPDIPFCRSSELLPLHGRINFEGASKKEQQQLGQ